MAVNCKHMLLKDDVDDALEVIHNISTGDLSSVCASEQFLTLAVPVSPDRYDSARQKADLIAVLLQDLGVAHHSGKSSHQI